MRKTLSLHARTGCFEPLEARRLLAADMLNGALAPSSESVAEASFDEPPPLFMPGILGGSVVAATHPEGLRQASDLGIAGVRLELLDSAGRIVAEAFSDESGKYLFPEMEPGVYSIREHQPLGLLDGLDWAGDGGGDVHSDADMITGILLTPGAMFDGYDFSEISPTPMASGLILTANASLLAFAAEANPAPAAAAVQPLPAPTLGRAATPLPVIVQRSADPVFGGSSQEFGGDENDAEAIHRAVADPDHSLWVGEPLALDDNLDDALEFLQLHADDEGRPLDAATADQLFDGYGEDISPPAVSNARADGGDAPAADRREAAPIRVTEVPAA